MKLSSLRTELRQVMSDCRQYPEHLLVFEPHPCSQVIFASRRACHCRCRPPYISKGNR